MGQAVATPYHAPTVIIGGGVAGASAAIVLAREGREVVLLEKEPQPSHKVCGEFLSPETIPMLANLGVDPRALGGVPIQRVRLVSRLGWACADLTPAATGLSRFALDRALLDVARGHGAEIRRGCTVRGYGPDEHGYRVETTDGDVSASRVILATGKHELPAIKVRGGVGRDAIGFKMHWEPDAAALERLGSDVLMFLYRGGYAGLCAVEGGRLNLCLIAHKKHFRRCGGSFAGLLEWLTRRRPVLGEILGHARMLWERPVTVSNIPYGYVYSEALSSRHSDGEFHVGDQFGVVPSLAGTGMALALVTGCAAARGILNGRGGHDVHQSVREHLEPTIRFAHRIHRLCGNPVLAEIAVTGLRAAPGLLKRLVAASRVEVYPVRGSSIVPPPD